MPLVLIFANTYLSAIKLQGLVAENLPVPRLADHRGRHRSLLLAIYLSGRPMSRRTSSKVMEDGIKSAGIILLVTGGAVPSVESVARLKTGDHRPTDLADAASGGPAAFLRGDLRALGPGSGTVAMITSASITAPILATSRSQSVLAAQAATLGAMVFPASTTLLLGGKPDAGHR